MRSRRLLVAACVVLAGYEIWTFFVRESAAVAIEGSHRRLIDEFGRGAQISQSFQMIGNGLRAIDVQLAADRPATVLIRCELSEITFPWSGPPIAPQTWFETIKHVSGADWRRISLPPLEPSNTRTFALRLQVIAAVRDGDDAVRDFRHPSADGRPQVAIVASKENLSGGGVLSISGQQRTGSLFLRAHTRSRTAYQRLRADVAPSLPPALRHPAVQIALAIAYQWALLTVVYALIVGLGGDAFMRRT